MRHGRASLILAVALSAFGCGGSSTHHSGANDAGSGGTGASGGTGGTGAGGGTGGDFMAPKTPAAVGLSITLSPPLASEVQNLGNRSCPAGDTGSFTYSIGQPAPTKTIEDGQAGVTVACTVKPVNGVATIGAEITGNDQDSGEPIALAIPGSVSRDPSVATQASVSFYTPNTLVLEVLAGSPNCVFDNVTTLKAGAMLSDFSCPLLAATDDSATGCRAQGTLAIEYCATE